MFNVQNLSLPPATKLAQGYVFTGVCHSVNGGGVPDTLPDLEQTPPLGPAADIPRTWNRHPPGPGTPPGSRHPPEQTPPLDQVHPPRHRACWEIRSMSRRYASYLNAILFTIVFTFYKIQHRGGST